MITILGAVLSMSALDKPSLTLSQQAIALFLWFSARRSLTLLQQRSLYF
ncbi:hypothetical protein [Nostoc sp.]